MQYFACFSCFVNITLNEQKCRDKRYSNLNNKALVWNTFGLDDISTCHAAGVERSVEPNSAIFLI